MRRMFTTIGLMSTSAGLLFAFCTLWPVGAMAQEPNKVILAIEILVSLGFLTFGIYSFVKEIKTR